MHVNSTVLGLGGWMDGNKSGFMDRLQQPFKVIPDREIDLQNKSVMQYVFKVQFFNPSQFRDLSHLLKNKH